MYAVIEQGGKQYMVNQGDVIRIELADIAGDAKTIEMDKVLLVGSGADSKIGSPYVDGAKVVGKFTDNAADAIVAGDKVFSGYRRRRKNSKKKIGHRQKFLEVTIDKIEA